MITYKYQHSVKCKDDKRRNYVLFFIDGQKALKLKWPYDEKYDYGHQNRTHIENLRYDDTYIYFTKVSDSLSKREVKYPYKIKNNE